MSVANSQKNQVSKSSSQRWRALVVGFLVGIGSIALANWFVLRWMNIQLFDTQNYVATVSGLTKNPDVANAISTYATQQFYSSINLEDRIREALPEKAAFLAVPLSGQIVASTEKIGTNIIASDQFNSVWISANQAAHNRLMTALRRPSAELAREQDRFVFGINISPLLDRLRERIGSSESIVASGSNTSQVAEIGIALKEKVQALRTAYQYSQVLYVLLPLIAIAAYLSAIAIASKRWSVLLAIVIAIMTIAALELIILKAIRPEVIKQVATSYQAAAGQIWDAFTVGFKRVLQNTLIVSVIMLIVVVLAGPFAWAKRLRQMAGFDRLAKTKLLAATVSAQQYLRKYITAWRVAGIALAFIVLILKPSISWQTVVQAILAYIIYVSSIEILAARHKTS